jgi:GT2 family glycosyltransferase
MSDLTICQDCQKNPAIYGDGVTWSRCAECQYKHDKEKPVAEAQAPIEDGSGFEHKTIPGLTSIIMPVYMVSYTLFHYTGNAIGSIREHTKKGDYELIVVDDGSPIKPPSEKSYYADKVIVNKENQGVTKSWNKGIRMSFGEYVVLVNNDVQVFNGWLENMKGVIDRGEADLVMAHPMYSLTEPFARATEASEVLSGIRKFDPIVRDFSCVMFKKTLIDELGLFDEDFISYCSDIEFFDRMDKAGKKYIVCDKVAVHHVSDATGFSVPETPDVMNKDKATYEKKKNEVPVVPSPVLADEPIAPPKEEARKVETKKSDKLIRAANTGDRIYFIGKDGKIHWIMNPEVLHALGFEFGQDTTLPVEEFAKYEKGENVSLTNVEQFK